MKRKHLDIIRDLEQGKHLPESEQGYQLIWDTAEKFEYPQEGNGDWEKLQAKIKGESNSQPKLNFIFRYKSIAAVITLLLLAGIFLIPYAISNKTKSISYTTQGGEVITINMEDGSQIILNGNSTLTTNSNFGKNHRKLSLTGEAFFSVTKNQELPFIVKTGSLNTKVLGTEFNVDAYQTKAITVHVKHGKVEVLHHKESLAVLTDNNTAQFDMEKGIQTNHESRRNLLSWQDSKESFTEAPLIEVIERLEKISGKKISYPENMKHEKVTTVLNVADLELALKVLSETIGAEVALK